MNHPRVATGHENQQGIPPALVVANVTISQDQDARFCLNDLKRAAIPFKGRRTTAVPTFMRRPETQDLIRKLSAAPDLHVAPVSTVMGWYGGTFVCKDIALAYAWGVGRAFLEVVQQAFEYKDRVSAAKENEATTTIEKECIGMEYPTENNSGLIQVFIGEIGGITCNVCDARVLHGFLGVGKDFTTWVKGRIKKYGFIEDEDFSISRSPNLGSRNNQGLSNLVAGDNRVEYHVTLDTAKELSMVENNEKGRAARKYFIACERQELEAVAGAKQPKIGNSMPALVEKACDMTSWRLANEYQQRTITLIGEAAHPGDDEMSWTVSFLIRKRLYDRLEAIAKELLRKNMSPEDAKDFILSWKPQALQSLDVPDARH